MDALDAVAALAVTVDALASLGNSVDAVDAVAALAETVDGLASLGNFFGNFFGIPPLPPRK